MKTERKLLTALVTILAALLLFAAPVRADEGDVKVASLSAPDITRFVTERMTSVWHNYHYNDETGDFEDAVWEEVDCWPRDEEVTVTMTDGTVISGTGTQVNIRLHERYGLELYWSSDQTPDDLWGVGDHTAQLFAGDFSGDDVRADFTVTLIENPIERLIVPDMTRYEGETEECWGYHDENGEYVDEQWFRINANPSEQEITVETTEGSVTGDLDRVIRWLEETFGMHFNCYWYSGETPLSPWTAGNTYTAFQTISGVEGEYSVTILENPDAVMTVEDIYCYDSHLSDWTDYFDEELGEWVDPGEKWRIEGHPDEIEVTVNGNVYRGNVDEVAWILADSENLPIDRWHWETDQVYGEPVPAEIHAVFTMGFMRAEYTIHVSPNPVESVSVAPITRMQGDNLSPMWGWNDPEGNYHDEHWFRTDCWPYDAAVTAVVSGKTYEAENVDDLREMLEADGYDLDLWWESDENPGNVWEPGEHTAVFYVGDVPAYYTVILLENPILSVTVPDISVYDTVKEERWGYYDENDNYIDEKWYRINADPVGVDVTVETTEGTFTGEKYEAEDWLRETFDYDFECYWATDETRSDPWTAGNTYTATLYFGGVGGDYNVTVLETPDAVLTVRDVDCFLYQVSGWTDYYDEDEDRWIDPGERWRIEGFPEEITVTVNGHEYSGYPDEVALALEENENLVINDWHWDSDQVYGEPVGETIRGTFRFGFMEAEYTIHVSPVTFESLEVPDITRFDTDRFEAIGEMYNESTGEYQEILWDKLDCWPRSAVCKVVMTNGDVYEGSIDQVMDWLEEDGYRDFENYWDSDETPDNPWEEGEYEAVFTLGNVSCEYTVTVVKNPITKIIVPDITRYDGEREEVHGYQSPWGAVTDETWYRINANPSNERIKVETTAGEFTGDLGEVLDWLEEKFGMSFDAHWDSDETPFDPWTVGNTYTAAQYIGGLAGEYRVTVLALPFENYAIEVADFERSETELSDWTDYYDEELDTWVDPGKPWRIDCWPDEIRVIIDGRDFIGSVGEVVEALKEEYGLVIHQIYYLTDQVYGESVPDEIYTTFTFGFMSTSYRVRVVRSEFSVTEPVPKDVVYNKAEQTLAEAGSTTAGTMYYALVKNDKDAIPAPSDFTEELPAAKDPGIYYIWTMVKDGEALLRSPACAGKAYIRFTDVAKTSLWYFEPVYWALENGVTSGMGEGTFQPTKELTRAQTVTFLYNLAGKPDVSGLTATEFSDVAKGAWYYDAVKWAVANKITSGYGTGTFQPNAKCTRAMVVTFLQNFAKAEGFYMAPITTASFKDVKANDWFRESVDWAVENGITAGYGTGTFSPKVICNRAMMVSFLKKVSELQN